MQKPWRPWFNARFLPFYVWSRCCFCFLEMVATRFPSFQEECRLFDCLAPLQFRLAVAVLESMVVKRHTLLLLKPFHMFLAGAHGQHRRVGLPQAMLHQPHHCYCCSWHLIDSQTAVRIFEVQWTQLPESWHCFRCSELGQTDFSGAGTWMMFHHECALDPPKEQEVLGSQNLRRLFMCC